MPVPWDPPTRDTNVPQVLELMAEAQKGNGAAWLALCHLFTPLLRSVAASYCNHADLREEVQGEVYVVFHRLVHQFDPQRGVSPYTYLLRTLAPAMHSYVRQHYVVVKRERPFSALVRESADDLHVEEQPRGALPAPWHDSGNRETSTEWQVSHRVLWELTLDRLPEAQRRVVQLRSEGFTFEEISVRLQSTPAACRQRFKRARHTLRTVLKETLLEHRHESGKEKHY